MILYAVRLSFGRAEPHQTARPNDTKTKFCIIRPDVRKRPLKATIISLLNEVRENAEKLVDVSFTTPPMARSPAPTANAHGKTT